MTRLPDSEDQVFSDATEPLKPGSSARQPVPVGAVIRVIDADAQPTTFRLTIGSCTIGSAPTSDIVIALPTVSRAHVELGLVPEGVSVRDLGSLNGTFFLGQRVERMTLALGGRLQVGSTTVAVDADTEALGNEPAFPGTFYRGNVGASPSMRLLFAMLARLEGSLCTVLIEGESGVGKERVAQALHEGSTVSKGPLVTLNCGSLPRELIASELFGHKKGAFSGAFDGRRGAFESADGGTLFLDEIGELPLDIQPMLLRAIELGEVRPLGDDHAHRVSVRIVAATNRDLEADVRSGKFRQDLFYRLAVVRLKVPPLRERIEDIEPLALRFAGDAGLRGLPPDVLDELKSRRWTGNARELRNAILAYGALGALPTRPAAQRPALEELFADVVDTGRPYADQKDEITDAFTRLYLVALLKRSRNNQSEAARMSGLNRNYLARLLLKYDLVAKDKLGGAEES